jgi:gamma-tubulin complex component 3
MTHFIQQMQYYIEFEVMECSWAEFSRRIDASEDIDQLVEAHEWFLDIVTIRSMVNARSEELSNHLRSIYEIVIEFQGVQVELSKKIEKELDARIAHDKKLREAIKTKSEVSTADIKTEHERRTSFETDTVPCFQTKIRMMANTYQSFVQQFLLQLANHDDADLQFLSVRLDFNEHYKKRNKNLETSFYHGHRTSMDTSIISNR